MRRSIGERELAKEDETIEGFLFTDSPSVVAVSASSPVVTTDADVLRMVLLMERDLIENEFQKIAQVQNILPWSGDGPLLQG